MKLPFSVCGLILIFTNSIFAQNSQVIFADASAEVENLMGSTNRDSGPAWGDFNNDGYQDLFIAAFDTNKLYLNNGDGSFSDVSASFDLNDPIKTIAANWGDINNDGFLDLYLSYNKTFENKLLLNQNGSGFLDISHEAGIADTNFAQGGAWADYDADGLLDFMLLQDDSEDRLFRNNGDLTFTDVAPDLDVDNEWGAYGITWLDYNDDNHPDLFIGNCANRFGENWYNLLFRNNGDGTFTDISAQLGVDYQGKSWGTVALDYDNDLDMDILVINTDAIATFLLYKNQDGVFIEVSEQANLTGIGNARGVTTGDYDNDGDLDFAVIGFSAQGFYLNNGDGTFTEATDLVEFPELKAPSYSGIATADYDNDGFLDFFTTATEEGGRGYLFHNEPSEADTGNNWLMVNLTGTTSNYFGVSSKVVAFADSLHQVRYVNAGSGLYTQNMLTVHFGLGTRTSVDTVVVRWPGGTVDTVRNIAVNQTIEITEGMGVPTHVSASEDFVPRNFELLQNYPNPFNPTTTINFTVREKASFTLSIHNLLGVVVRHYDLGIKAPGSHSIIWDGKDSRGFNMPSSIYFYTLHSPDFKQSRKMILSH